MGVRWDVLVRVLTLADYNTRVVVAGAVLLGAASGLIGTFMLLRKRALVGDAISHATLPGIALGFAVMVGRGGSGRFLPGLLIGAALTGLLGVASVHGIRRFTRLKEDAALGIVLSVYFGLGVALLRMVQTMRQGSAAGLETFIYGKTASMLAADAWLMGGAAAAMLALCLVLYKELKVTTFDPEFAAAQGLRVRRLDALVMGLVVGVTVAGLQAVGLILVIALLVIPAAAARFWTERLGAMLAVAGGLGALSGYLGTVASALWPRMPAGAMIVLTASAMFGVSLVFGRARGAWPRWREHHALVRRIRRHHLLRAMVEAADAKPSDPEAPPPAVPEAVLLGRDGFSPQALTRELHRAARDGEVIPEGEGAWRFTATGWRRARHIVRSHRLWEQYLIAFADVAPSHVDSSADRIEHVLGEDLVAELEGRLGEGGPAPGLPASPHPLDGHPSGAGGRTA